MKLVKSLLLGSATGLMAVAGAQAADLPVRKAAPVEYVRVCDAYGAGFFYIPGTETCLRVGGYVRAEYLLKSVENQVAGAGVLRGFTTRSSRSLDATGLRARAGISLDARTQTAWGTLRAFSLFDYTSDQGAYIGGGNLNYFSMRLGFIQWAGITAGYTQSFFDFYAASLNWGSFQVAGTPLPVLAYTATFGGGFSATIGIEDRNRRQAAAYGGLAGVTSAGYRFPNFVANLRVDQGWGSAQLSAAANSLNSQRGTAIGTVGKDEWGWAVQGGVKINLPMLAAGDHLYLQATYTKGAIDYVGLSSNSSSVGNLGLSGSFLNHGHDGLQYAGRDAYCYNVIGGGYTCEKTEAWQVAGAFRHFWAPNFYQTLFASYTHFKPGTITRSLDWTLGGVGKGEKFQVGTNLVWNPVAGFDVGLELIYSRVNQNIAGGRNIVTGAPQLITALPVGTKASTDSYEARLRLNRAF